MKQVGLILRKAGLLAAVYLVMFLIVFYSKELSEGIKGGIHTSLNLLLPSMLIFLIFSNALMASGLAPLTASPFRFLSNRIFRIPENEIVIVVLSLVGGYPVGAKLLSDGVKEGRILPETASRMLAYCVNCGPAFLISGVGVGIFRSLRLGVMIYLSQIAACILIGGLSGIGRRDCKISHKKQFSSPVPQGGSVILVNAVTDAIRSMAIICGFVVAFSAFLPVISSLLSKLPAEIGYFLRGLLEVTTGCANLSLFENYDPVLLAALFTGFGGICVHLQVCAMLKGSGVSMKRFYLWRIPYIAFSMLSLKGMLMLFPGITQTLGIRHDIKNQVFSVSPAATFFLVLLCIMLLFFRGKSATLKKRNQ